MGWSPIETRVKLFSVFQWNHTTWSIFLLTVCGQMYEVVQPNEFPWPCCPGLFEGFNYKIELTAIYVQAFPWKLHAINTLQGSNIVKSGVLSSRWREIFLMPPSLLSFQNCLSYLSHSRLHFLQIWLSLLHCSFCCYDISFLKWWRYIKSILFFRVNLPCSSFIITLFL